MRPSRIKPWRVSPPSGACNPSPAVFIPRSKVPAAGQTTNPIYNLGGRPVNLKRLSLSVAFFERSFPLAFPGEAYGLHGPPGLASHWIEQAVHETIRPALSTEITGQWPLPIAVSRPNQAASGP